MIETTPTNIKDLLYPGIAILPDGPWADFTRIPNQILRASDLSSDEKVVLALLMETYQFAADSNSLDSQGRFFFCNARFEDFTDKSGKHIVKTAVAGLIKKHLVSSKQQGVGADKKNYYTLDWYNIFNHEGKTKDRVKEQKKKDKALNASSGRKRKETEIKKRYRNRLLHILQTTNSLSCDKAISELALEISLEYHWQQKTAVTLLKQLEKDLRDSGDFNGITNNGWADPNSPAMKAFLRAYGLDQPTNEEDDDFILI